MPVKKVVKDAFSDVKIPRDMKESSWAKFKASIENREYQNKDFEVIEIPASVNSIGNYAFIHCKSLRNATLQEGLESIGTWAFGESGLETIEIPASVTSIGGWAFRGCKSLRNATLHEGLKSIGTWAFGESGLEAIEIPASVKSIRGYAFFYCKSLRNATLHKGLESIGTWAFLGSDLEEIEIPASVKNIGEYAFGHCELLRNVTLHEGLESIGTWAFRGCKSLRNATLQEGLESIGWHAFEDSGLETIEIPASVKSIGLDAFSGCDLKYIIVPNGNTSILNLLQKHLRGKIIEKQFYDKACEVVKDSFSQAISDPLGVRDLPLDNTDFSKILADVKIPRDMKESSWAKFKESIESKMKERSSPKFKESIESKMKERSSPNFKASIEPNKKNRTKMFSRAALCFSVLFLLIGIAPFSNIYQIEPFYKFYQGYEFIFIMIAVFPLAISIGLYFNYKSDKPNALTAQGRQRPSESMISSETYQGKGYQNTSDGAVNNNEVFMKS